MFWRKKKNREDRMPWYRRRDYMTSAPHPARARYKPSVRTPDMLCFWRLLPTSLLALVLMTVSQIPTWTAEAGNASKCDRSRFRIVVDVGHTVQAPGAMSARNVPEYDFNLRLGQQIQQRLIADRFTGTVLLMTEGGARPSLFKRVATANELPADMVLSSHHASVPSWFLEDWEFEGSPSHFTDSFSSY